jgi:CBS domain containing-hemolysin-like protein
MIVAESQEDGHINASERDLIQNVFDFDNRQVSEIMTPAHKAFTYNIESRTKESVHQLMDEGYSRIPFYEGNINNIIGRVLLKDILHYYIKNSDNLNIKSLIRPIQFVPENMKIDDCLKHLQAAHYHMAVVTSEYGTTL